MGKPEPLLSFCSSLFEYTVHKPSKYLINIISLAFPVSDHKPSLLVVLCFQKTKRHMFSRGSDTQEEKDELLEKFYSWGSEVAALVRPHWTELVDPSSGGPMLGEGGSSIFSDIEAIQELLGYKIASVAGCCVAEHPRFGNYCYPSSLITSAPLEDLEKVLKQAKIM